MDRADRERQIGAVAALRDVARRALYEFVVAQPEPVGRDQAAQAAGISRPLAAFHLDRLVDAGLLEASYRRLSGRSGPGAGRTSKLYRRASTEVTVSLPQREYELAAGLLVKAIADAPAAGARESLDRVARSLGERIGQEVRDRCGSRPSRKRIREAALSMLGDRGFEPFMDEAGAVRLRNCPFHALATEQPELVCGMNVALIQGMLSGIGEETGSEAVLEPGQGVCCVALKGWS